MDLVEIFENWDDINILTKWYGLEKCEIDYENGQVVTSYICIATKGIVEDVSRRYTSRIYTNDGRTCFFRIVEVDDDLAYRSFKHVHDHFTKPQYIYVKKKYYIYAKPRYFVKSFPKDDLLYSSTRKRDAQRFAKRYAKDNNISIISVPSSSDLFEACDDWIEGEHKVIPICG